MQTREISSFGSVLRQFFRRALVPLFCLLPLLALLPVCVGAGQQGRSEIPIASPEGVTENMLFCNARGYTNVREADEPGKNRERAVVAAKYLVEKKVRSLIGAELQDQHGFALHQDADGEFFHCPDKGVNEVPVAGDNLYGIQLSGVLSYSIPDSLQSTSSGPSFAVTLSASKEKYTQGESLVLQIQGNKDFYACLLNVTPDGQVLQLLPNSNREVARFSGGITHTFPNQFNGDNFELEVNPPYGREIIYLLASDHNFSGLPGVGDDQLFSSTSGPVDVLTSGIKKLLLQDMMAQSDTGSLDCRHLIIRKIVVETEGV